jgi:hypothetical protein
MKPLKGYQEAYLDLPLGLRPDNGAQSELNRKQFPEKMIRTQQNRVWNKISGEGGKIQGSRREGHEQ